MFQIRVGAGHLGLFRFCRSPPRDDYCTVCSSAWSVCYSGKEASKCHTAPGNSQLQPTGFLSQHFDRLGLHSSQSGGVRLSHKWIRQDISQLREQNVSPVVIRWRRSALTRLHTYIPVLSCLEKGGKSNEYPEYQSANVAFSLRRISLCLYVKLIILRLFLFEFP